MSWILPVRAIGVVAGLILFGLGTAWLLAGLSDPPSQNYWSYVLFGASLLVPGALMAAPWSRIRSRPVWYTLFVVLLVTVLPGAALILAVNTWSAMHGAGGTGYALAGLLVGAWVIQLPAIWALRPNGKPAA